MKTDCATYRIYGRYLKAIKRLERATAKTRSTTALDIFQDKIFHLNAKPLGKSVKR